MNNKNRFATGVALILTIGLLVGSAAAWADEGDGKDVPESFKSEILSKAADILEIEEKELVDALNDAFKTTLIERIEELVDEGWIGEKRAELMKKRIEERADEELFLLRYIGGHRRFERRPLTTLRRRLFLRRN